MFIVNRKLRNSHNLNFWRYKQIMLNDKQKLELINIT